MSKTYECPECNEVFTNDEYMAYGTEMTGEECTPIDELSDDDYIVCPKCGGEVMMSDLDTFEYTTRPGDLLSEIFSFSDYDVHARAYVPINDGVDGYYFVIYYSYMAKELSVWKCDDNKQYPIQYGELGDPELRDDINPPVFEMHNATWDDYINKIKELL